MTECWLRANRRAVWPSFVLPLTFGLASGIGCTVAALSGASWYVTVPLAVITVFAIFLCGVLGYWASLPRLAVANGRLLVYLGGLQPERVPLEFVEVFFRGQGEAGLPSREGKVAQVTNIVVRLAESATEWQQRETRPELGTWCGGYVTIRGTWCEPITADLLLDLNARLVAVHRAQRTSSEEAKHDAAAGQRS